MRLTCVTATYNVIAAGNRERLIRCVESVAKIPVEHEHLIYDGASTDGTVELLRELEKTTPGLKVVSEPDTGIYNALNKGVRDAKGVWFHVLGCDDFICDPEVMVEAIAKGESTLLDWVGAPIVYENGTKSESFSDKMILTGMPFAHGGAIMKTRLIRDHNGFDEGYRIAADFDLFQRLIFDGVLWARIGRSFFCFSRNGISSVNSDTVDEHRDILSKRHRLKGNDVLNAYPKRILPLRIVLPCLLGARLPFRLAARYQLGRWIANHFGLIDSAGHFRFKHK